MMNLLLVDDALFPYVWCGQGLLLRKVKDKKTQHDKPEKKPQIYTQSPLVIRLF